MSSEFDPLSLFSLQESDVKKFLACQTHIGSTNLHHQMQQYVYKRRQDGVHIIDLNKAWWKVHLAARAIVAIENPADVCVVSSRPFAQRAVLKFAKYTGATAIAGRFTPGTFTNPKQGAFTEPQLLIIADPIADHQAVTESSYVNLPVIAFCNTESPLRFIDVAIPCNNKGSRSIGLMLWMLAREVLAMRGRIDRSRPWEDEVKVDLFFYRGNDEAKEEQAALVQEPIKAFTKTEEPIAEDYNDNSRVEQAQFWTTDNAPQQAVYAAPPKAVQAVPGPWEDGNDMGGW